MWFVLILNTVRKAATLAPCYVVGSPFSMPSYFNGKRDQNSYRLSRKKAFFMLLFTTFLRDQPLSLAGLSVPEGDIQPFFLGLLKFPQNSPGWQPGLVIYPPPPKSFLGFKICLKVRMKNTIDRKSFGKPAMTQGGKNSVLHVFRNDFLSHK